jgi:hypothetical protein
VLKNTYKLEEDRVFVVELRYDANTEPFALAKRGGGNGKRTP